MQSPSQLPTPSRTATGPLIGSPSPSPRPGPPRNPHPTLEREAPNYAGTSPITRTSGKQYVALARFVRNARLADAIDQGSFCSISASLGARAFYDARRAAGDSHHKALRALGNRWIGILHGGLRHERVYDETTAWAHRIDNDLKKIPIAA